MKKVLLLLTAFGAAAVAQAGVISPGGTTSATVTVNNDGAIVAGPLAVGPIVVPGTGLVYSLTSRVWNGDTGNTLANPGLTFEYEIGVIAFSSDDLQSAATVSYASSPAPIDAGFVVNPSASTEVDWSASGVRLHVGTDIPKNSTHTFWVHTSATQWTDGVFAATHDVGLRTFVPVPEPHEYALLAGLGLLGLAAYRRIRA